MTAVRTRYREVVLFATGQMKDSRPLVQHIYEMLVEHYLNHIRTSGDPYIKADLFRSLHSESTVRLFDDPLHNKYINYYDHDEDTGDPDITSVYFLSQVYRFQCMRHEVVLEKHLTQGEEIPPCAMRINLDQTDEAVRDSLLSICSEIFTHQPVTDLWMWGVTCNSLEAPRLTKPVSVDLSDCKFSDVFIKLFRQLIECHCGESLQKLDLYAINLSPFEPLLDELLEDLVAHHQRKREAGLAQRKLVLRLWGDKEDPTNLSSRFVEKWQNRCEKVDSIDCMIDDYEPDSDDMNDQTEEEDESEEGGSEDGSECSESGSGSSSTDESD